jgi:hypothetical protein
MDAKLNFAKTSGEGERSTLRKYFVTSGTVYWVGMAEHRLAAAVLFLEQCYPRLRDMSQSVTISENGPREPGARDSITLAFFEVLYLTEPRHEER